jgi:hypothetical protein
MAWESHGRRAYYYRSFRRAGKAVKVYCGTGVTGRVAAAVDARRRAEREAGRAALLNEQARLAEVEVLTRQFQGHCELLAEAALLAAGFHRPGRHQWRRRHEAFRAIRGVECGGDL